MKQGIRFLVKPKQFFNQLQWSTNHWLIILSFLVLATFETQLGKSNHLYASFAAILQARFGMNLDFALWIIVASRLVLMSAGALGIATLIYLVGSMLGRQNSRRVFYRRIAVVLTVFLSAYTVGHFASQHVWLQYVSWALYAWATLLGFVAVQEQFGLNVLETALVSAFTVVTIATTWHFSNKFFETQVRTQITRLARPMPAETANQSLRFGGGL